MVVLRVDPSAWVRDNRYVTAEELAERPHAAVLSLQEVLPLLASPDSGHALEVVGATLDDGASAYPVQNGLPILYPQAARPLFMGGAHQQTGDALLQYLALSKYRQSGEITASQASIHAQRHFFRMQEFASDLRGVVLDVGCDDVSLSASLYPPTCRFVGIDPYAAPGQFRVVGVGEMLPFHSSCIDNVVFNTSLDHILDYNQALGEAKRVLRDDGVLVICTLIWIDRATLLTDAVHFHHFREWELAGALESLGFKVEDCIAYSYKEDTHRYGLYIRAVVNG